MKVLLIVLAVIAVLVFLKFIFGGKKRQPVFLSGITLSESGGYRHKYVDMGLPSGKLWATCNVGANNPTEYGDYFAWGEVKPKDEYSWDNYKFMSDSYTDNHNYEENITKYMSDEYGGVRDPDNLTTLELVDDAAASNWGNSWHMPTKQEFQELIDNCKWQWTDNLNDSGVAGILGTSTINGNTIFFPASDIREDGFSADLNNDCCYWTASLCVDDPGDAYFFYFYCGYEASDDIEFSYDFRSLGLPVRAITNRAVEDV